MSSGSEPQRAELAATVRALPTGPGVYRFRDRRDAVLYLGRATNLRSRVGSYFSDRADRRRLGAMVAAIGRIEAVSCASRHEAAWLERLLLSVALPPWNRTPGGQEVPVAIGVQGGPAAPGLRLHHLPHVRRTGPLFGPYLGGLQVRRAIAGLNRLYPLSYAGSRLSTAELAMAERRGVRPTDRQALLDRLIPVLRREPGAVSLALEDLRALRTDAAAGSAFELAARVQDELLGLEWISSVQRVSALAGGEEVDDDRAETTVAGFCDGLLVTFSVRDGSVVEWRSARCAPDASSAVVGRTPGAWRSFAEQNAELAARLDRAARGRG